MATRVLPYSPFRPWSVKFTAGHILSNDKRTQLKNNNKKQQILKQNQIIKKKQQQKQN